MKSIFESQRIELLESRIAPANVTISFLSGALTVDTDGGNVDVEIIQVDKTHFRVQGLDGIDIGGNVNGATLSDASFQDITGTLKTLTINGGDGQDNFTLSGLKNLRGLVFNGGDEDDNLSVNNAVIKGPVTISLGEGNGADQVNFGGGSLSITGSLAIDYGDSGASVTMNSASTIVSSVILTGGAGDDLFTLSGGPTKITKALIFTAGDGDNTLTLAAPSLTIGKSSTAEFLGRSISYEGGADSDSLVLDSSTATLGASIYFAGGDGSNGLTVDGSTVKIGKNLVTSTETVAIGSFGQSIYYLGGDGNDDLTIDASSITASGSIEMHGDVDSGGDGSGYNQINLTGNVAKIGKSTATPDSTFGGRSLVLLGDSTDTITSVSVGVASLTIAGSLNLDLVAGDTSVNLDATVLKMSGAVNIAGGAGTDTVNLSADGFIKGAVLISLGTAAGDLQSVNLESGLGAVSGLQFKSTVTVSSSSSLNDDGGTSEFEGDRFSSTNISVAKAMGINLGDGSNQVNVNNLAALQTLGITTGTGVDEVLYETETNYGASVAKGVVTIDLGAGIDTLTIGNSSLAGSSALVNFLSSVATPSLVILNSTGDSIDLDNVFFKNNLAPSVS